MIARKKLCPACGERVDVLYDGERGECCGECFDSEMAARDERVESGDNESPDYAPDNHGRW